MFDVRQSLRVGLALVAFLIVPFVLAEALVRAELFRHVPYTGSDAMDRTLRDFAARSLDDWRLIMIGDSEVRWGFDPRPIEAALSAVAPDVATFNYGIDGFSSGWSPKMVDRLGVLDRARNLRVAILGVQLIETHGTVDDNNICSALTTNDGFQAAIFKSAFGRDQGFARACDPSPTIPARIVGMAEAASAIFRYRREIRSLVLGRGSGLGPVFGLADVAMPTSYQGFQPHKPIVENSSFLYDLDRMRADLAADEASRQPLPAAEWEALTSEGGYFDQIRAPFDQRNILVVFVAQPTNPLLIDFKNRRSTYVENSARLSAYAERTGAVFIDLGIQDEFDADHEYSDHRHLSEQGAARFSAMLGQALALNGKVRAALSR